MSTLLCRDVVVMPTVKKCIYGVAVSNNEQICHVQDKFDIMMTIFFTLVYGSQRDDLVSLGKCLYDHLIKEYPPKV